MDKQTACTKAIIPVAGFGTRRLPITKAVEKCMLPIGDRPIIDYVVEDCLKAGVKDFYFVVGEEFAQLKRYYGHHQLLEEHLRDHNKQTELDQILGLTQKARFHYVIQDQHQPYGTAVPVALCARMINEGEQVLVAGGDDFVYRPDGSSQMARLLNAVHGAGVTAGMLAAEVPQKDVGRYGVLQAHPDTAGNLIFEKVVEHPDPQTTPSTLINITKFVFDSTMLDCAKKVLDLPPAANGEYQLTDALNLYSKQKHLLVLPVDGEYLDGGTTEGWLYANNRILGNTAAR
ncbi:MAG TPA: sugar phosphate nucleotidyltransferase [Candidatus Saccharimonadales bacterium]|nr:sugar phosphate nucleotidyltransferase [Candidatus Saccharimonadales bacterium]